MIHKIFRRKDKQFIFNFAAVIGVGLTMASTIRDTTKACKLVDDNMTFNEKIKKTWKCYIPSGLIATSTIVSIIYSDYVTMNEKISMLNALMSVQNNYKVLRNGVNEVCDASTKEEIMKRNIRDKIPKDIYLERTDEKIFFEEYNGRFFTSTLDNVLKAEYLFNKQLYIVGHASLNDLYKLLGLSTIDSGDYLGWETYDGNYGMTYVNPLVNFTHEKMEDDSGLEYFYLGYSNHPDAIHDVF